MYGGSGHGSDEYGRWAAIKSFKHNKIIEIGVGFEHSLFLDSNGIVWSCGFNDCGELGLGHWETQKSMLPQPITHFIENGIKIKHIKCGHSYNLAVDANNKLWSWGSNKYGQCGNGEGKKDHNNKPKLIYNLKHENIIDIGCGASHCYAKTSDGMYWMWGDNEFNQCIGCGVDNVISIPICVNEIIYEKTNHKYLIKAMYLGYDNTKILMHTK